MWCFFAPIFIPVELCVIWVYKFVLTPVSGTKLLSQTDVILIVDIQNGSKRALSSVLVCLPFSLNPYFILIKPCEQSCREA